MRSQGSRGRARILSSIVAGLFGAAVILNSVLFDREYRGGIASLTWRAAANGLLFGLLVYAVLIPLVERSRARRRIHLADLVILVGCLTFEVAFCWLIAPS